MGVKLATTYLLPWVVQAEAVDAIMAASTVALDSFMVLMTEVCIVLTKK